MYKIKMKYLLHNYYFHNDILGTKNGWPRGHRLRTQPEACGAQLHKVGVDLDVHVVVGLHLHFPSEGGCPHPASARV